MKSYTNFEDFLDSKFVPICFIFRLTTTRHLKVLLGNKLHNEYADEVTRKLLEIQKEICENHWCSSLNEIYWNDLKANLVSLVKTLKSKETIEVTVVYEIDDQKDLAVELSTIII